MGLRPENDSCPADIVLPPPAGQADAAPDDGLGHHPLAGPDGSPRSFVHFTDDADELVAEYPGKLDLPPPLVDVEVGAADAGALHLDERLARAGPRGIHLLDREMSLPLVHERPHPYPSAWQSDFRPF